MISKKSCSFNDSFNGCKQFTGTPHHLQGAALAPGGFLKALGQLPDKMNLLGFNDYQDFCREYLDDTENWLTGSLRTA
jgi:hypothetical protein